MKSMRATLPNGTGVYSHEMAHVAQAKQQFIDFKRAVITLHDRCLDQDQAIKLKELIETGQMNLAYSTHFHVVGAEYDCQQYGGNNPKHEACKRAENNRRNQNIYGKSI